MKPTTAVVLLLLCCFTTIGTAQTLEQVAQGLEDVVMYGYVDAVTIEDVLVVSTGRGLLFYDTSDPLNPEYYSLYENQPNTINYGDLLAFQGYLYTAYGIFDVSEPRDPQRVSNFSAGGNTAIFQSLTYHNYLISGNSDDFKIYDIEADPVNPPLIVTFNNPNGRCYRMIGGFNRAAFLWTHSSAEYVRVMDMTNINNPRMLHTTGLGFYDYIDINMKAYGNAIYIYSNTETEIVSFDDGASISSLNDRFINVGENLLLMQDDDPSELLNIYTLDDPLDPELAGTIERPGYLGFFAQPGTGYAYLCATSSYQWDSAWMDVLDMRDPANPVLIERGIRQSIMTQVLADGAAAWSMTAEEGFWAGDYTDPSTLEEVHCQDDHKIRCADYADGYLYLAHRSPSSEGVLTIDVSNPLDPVVTDLEPTDVSSSSTMYEGELACGDDYLVVNHNDGFKIYGLGDPSNPEFIVQTIDLPHTPCLLSADGSVLYAVEWEADLLWAYDMSNPEFPHLLGSETFYLGWQGDYFRSDHGRIAALYRGTNADAVLIDARDPANMVLAHEFTDIDRDDYKISFDFENDLFFISAGTEIRVYDVTDLYNPALLATAPAPFWTTSLIATETYVYALIYDDLYIYQYSGNGPDLELTLVGINTTVPTDGGNVVYDATLASNYTNPISSDVWVTVDAPNSQTYETFRRTITVHPGTTQYTGLMQYVPPFAPAGEYTLHVQLGYYPSYVAAMDWFTFSKSAVDITTGSGDWTHSEWVETGGGKDDPVHEYGVKPPNEFALSEAWPNPFNPSTSLTLLLADAAAVNVTVYNIHGRNVATLTDGRLSAGTHTLTWSPEDAASGVYFVRATVNNQPLPTRKLVYMR